MSDLRQSPAWANYLLSLGWKIEKVDNTFAYLKKFPLLGYFVKIQRPSILNNKIINFIETKYHPFQFSVEPIDTSQVKLLQKLNFKLSNSPSLPTKTLVVALTKSQQEILNSFSQKVRYNIKLSQKKNVSIEETKDILEFTNFWRQNFEKKRLPFLSQQKNIIAIHKSFGKNSKILLAKNGRQTIAVLFLLFYDEVAYYLYGAASDAGRTNFAPTLLTWHAIQLSKKLGCKVFDFDGIYDSRFPIESWQGFTKFKEGFSKNEVKYPGNFTSYSSALQNILYSQFWHKNP